MVGVLGGCTTFSTLGYETLELLRGGSHAAALLNAAGQVHTTRILRLSEDLPVLDEMVKEGLVTVEKAIVIFCRTGEAVRA